MFRCVALTACPTLTGAACAGRPACLVRLSLPVIRACAGRGRLWGFLFVLIFFKIMLLIIQTCFCRNDAESLLAKHQIADQLSLWEETADITDTSRLEEIVGNGEVRVSVRKTTTKRKLEFYHSEFSAQN